jgi:hypothetical protein
MAIRWYQKVTTAPDGDFEVLADALDWFDDEYERGRRDLNVEGQRIDQVSAKLGGLMTYYYGLQQEIDGIHQWLEIHYTRVLQKARKGYLEHYNKTLTDRMAQQYAEADDEVLTIRLLINEVALRNRLYQGITKGLETLSFRLGDITKLRTAGIEDATI